MLKIENQLAELRPYTVDPETGVTTLKFAFRLPKAEPYRLERVFPGIGDVIDAVDTQTRAKGMDLAPDVKLPAMRLLLQTDGRQPETIVSTYEALARSPKVEVARGDDSVRVSIECKVVLDETGRERLSRAGEVARLTLHPATEDIEDAISAAKGREQPSA